MLDLFTLKLFNIVDELREKSKKGYKYILDCRDNEYKYYVTYDHDHKIYLLSLQLLFFQHQ